MKRVLIIFLVLSFSFLKIVSGAGIVGVSPGNVDFKNVLRGGYAERAITITINSEEPVIVGAKARGEIEGWLDFSQNISASKNSPGKLLISVKPPVDIPNGNYSGFVRIETESLASDALEGHATSSVKAALDVVVRVEITDLEILECQAGNFNVESVEKGDDAMFKLGIRNQGNIRLSPAVKIDIWDQEQISIVKTEEFRSKEILPTKEESLTFNVPTNDLELDQYWVEITVPDCFASDTLTFDVLEPGALKAEGILLRLVSKVWAEVDETLPIIANFQNIGEKNVDAKFKGQITRDGKIIQILESEESVVPMKEITNFTFYFTPGKAGKYIASGRVFYDKKRTFESSTIINVNPKRFGVKQVILIVVYLLILLIILFLFYSIRKEKRRYLEKLRRLR